MTPSPLLSPENARRPLPLRRDQRPRALISIGFLLTLASLTSLGPAPLEGQLVMGQLTDGLTKDPVAEAEVVLLSDARAVVARGMSNAQGLYAVRPGEAGIFFLTVSRLGYASGDTLRIIVPEGHTARVDLDLQPEGVELPGIVVKATRLSSFLDRRGFYQRQHRGRGKFLDATDLQESPGRRLVDHLRRLPGVIVRGNSPLFLRNQALSVRRAGPCSPTLLLDGMPMAEGSDEFDFVPVEWITGVEVYPTAAVVPAQWRHLAHCGLIVVWTG